MYVRFVKVHHVYDEIYTTITRGDIYYKYKLRRT